MGTGSSKPAAADQEPRRSISIGTAIGVCMDMCFVTRLMEAGGCGDELTVAMGKCHPNHVGEDPNDVQTCVRATTALRKCMASNKALFKGYIRILDEEERRRSGEPAYQDEESPRRFKWWAGMRTS